MLYDNIRVDSLEKLEKLAFFKMIISFFERSKVCTVDEFNIAGMSDKLR
jgi:hypothetical protein